MFSARLGSRLSRLGNIVLGYISQPFIAPPPFGTRNKALIENQSARSNTQHASRSNMQSMSRPTQASNMRRVNTQTNRRR